MPNTTVPADATGLPASGFGREFALRHAGDDATHGAPADEAPLTVEDLVAIEIAPLSETDLACIELPDDLSGAISAMRIARELLARTKAELIKIAESLREDEFISLIDDYSSAREFHEREAELMRAVEARLMIAGAAYGLSEARP